MSLRNTKALRFSPQGLSDALAEEDAFPGACAVLTNLIPDPSTKNLWTPRPASISLTTFGSFTTPTGVTVFKIIGSYVYGMVSSGHFAGKDEPFVYNLLTNTFVTVTGVNSGNIPTTQPTTGDWVPPTMDIVGTNVYVTHPGFDGVTNFVGWFDITVVTAPVWHSGNLGLINVISTGVITSGGSGYTNGTYLAVPLTGGHGAGATANITVAGGIVTAVTIVNGGVFYAIGDQLSASSQTLGIGGVGFIWTVTAVAGAGIQTLIIINGGVGYTNGNYTGIQLGGGSGSGATANFVVSGGTVISVVPNAPGSGYLPGDIVTASGVALTLGTLVQGSGYTNGVYLNVPLQGGTGQGITANITVAGGKVTKVMVVNGGSGYVVGDTLNLANGSVTVLGSPIGQGSGLTDGQYNGVNQFSTNGQGVGIICNFLVGGGTVNSTLPVNGVPVYGGTGYSVGDTINYSGATFGNPSSSPIFNTVSSISTVIGSGTGFSIKVATISSGSLGAGGVGFSAEVFTTTPLLGFIKFTTVPAWVRQFNGRAWFGINPPTGIPSVIFTDVYAFNVTNANQALSFGDNTPLTAAAPLGLANLLGGVVQSLIIFKSLNGIIQVTGDATTNNLTVNQVPGGSGTISPRSVTEHPQGLLYLDHDGYRMVTLDGNCTDPIGVAGQGVVVPFLNPVTPTRVSAGCNGTVLRVSVNTALSGWQEYWFDTVRKVWSGPHTFPTTAIDTYQGAFIIVAQAAPAALFSGPDVPTLTSTFTENAVPMTWTYQTVVLNDNMEMAESEIAEMQVKTNAVTGLASVVVAAIENGITGGPTAINSMTYTFGGNSPIAARAINFNSPVVYNRLTITITGSSKLGFKIGDIFVRARELGYKQLYA